MTERSSRSADNNWAQNPHDGAQHAPRGLILVADDDADSRNPLQALLHQEGFAVQVATDGADAAAKLETIEPVALLTDLRMPGIDGLELLRRAKALRPDLVVVVMTGFAEVESAIKAIRGGAADYISKPVRVEELVLILEREQKRIALERETKELRGRLRDRIHAAKMIGTSPAMDRVFKTVEQVAPSRASVLIQGESGTGKDLVAQAIHEGSPRASGPFVRLHCAALSESLLESELFGHEKGAFTGATSMRDGRFFQAGGGTLFLDEIGEIPPSVQVRLLRFLQERAFERVGGNETLHVDVRVIAATNRDLRSDVAQGRFREDLFYRLNVVNIEIPPLRARPGDLLALATSFLHRFAAENGKTIEGFDGEALRKLGAYRWPGNVRELENVIERVVVLCDGPMVTSSHLPSGLGATTPGVVHVPGATLDEIERHAILTTLEAVGGSTIKAAQMLNISVRKIQYKLHEYGVATPRRPSRRPAPS